MAYAVNELDGAASAYTAGIVIDANLIRQLLRIVRKRRFSSSRKAAAAAGLAPFTVAKIENLKTYPDYDPGIGIILRMLAALKLSLPTFIEDLRSLDARFEDLQKQRGGTRVRDASDGDGQADAADESTLDSEAAAPGVTAGEHDDQSLPPLP